VPNGHRVGVETNLRDLPVISTPVMLNVASPELAFRYSHDLTQLTLGLDRDSSLVAELYDERNDAVKKLISGLIKVAKSKGVKVGICGQGPSDFPDFAAFLVGEGIDSISITPDSVLKTIQTLARQEKTAAVFV
jgi:phosphoenolpyruvate synthase/pyruvate phosphate dikinase